ncbi:hypothetical protein BDR26DRAFT_917266 [Obelidium mucronatum]|nr:hypothetical protein BDR26DRAFT_917266 [Obelidium mucronatum]
MTVSPTMWTKSTKTTTVTTTAEGGPKVVKTTTVTEYKPVQPERSIKQRLDEDGYVIIDGMVSDEELVTLRAAADRAVAKARNDEWKLRRVVGVQFPPWGDTAEDVWGVQHIMHPDMQEPAFAKWYGCDKLLDAVCEILDSKEEELQLELFNMLINPEHKDFALEWHRDDVKPNVEAEEEIERLSIPHYGTQWNTALYDDACLYIIPKSHNRIRTPEERNININDPLCMNMPGAIAVELKAGQTVFYNNNIMHRAVYDKSKKRATLHGCMGTVLGGPHRARNILQHGVAWMREERFKQTLPPRLYPLYDNLISLANQNEGKDLGFSQ